MSSLGVPTQDSTYAPSPCSTPPIDNAEQIMSEDGIPTPTDSNQVNCTADSADTLALGRKRGLTSIVWSHFKREKVDDKWKEVCNYCSKKLGGDTKNGTKHLHDHFKICPLRKSRDIKQSILAPKSNTDGRVNLGTFTFNDEEVRKNMASMIIVHEYPLNMVEHSGFRGFVSSLQPLFKVVSRNTVKKDIMKIYEFEKNKIMGVFDRNTSKIAITTDMWTTNNKKKGYMVVTTHFIDESWHLQSRIVRTDLDNYLEERVIPRKEDFDILGWWKNAHSYPVLQLVARDVLAIPISTVASESAFSTSGRFVSPHRSMLNHDTLEALICTQDWVWNDKKEIGKHHTFYGDIDSEEDGEEFDTEALDMEF